MLDRQFNVAASDRVWAGAAVEIGSVIKPTTFGERRVHPAGNAGAIGRGPPDPHEERAKTASCRQSRVAAHGSSKFLRVLLSPGW